MYPTGAGAGVRGEAAEILSVMVNIAVGLVTSVISGSCVWLWQRGKQARALRRKAAFFGIAPGGECLIVMNDKYDRPGSAAHRDVRAMIEVATLASELGCQVSVESSNVFRGSNDGRTEFCIGGPWSGSNLRTGGHLTAHVPGVAWRPFGQGPDSNAIVVGDKRFTWDRGNEEYALVAKFTPPESTRPVFLVCGQSSLANHAAVHFLKRAHKELTRVVSSIDRFCIVVRVSSIATYGFQRTGLEGDVTAAAFAGPV
ncbi:hypothetical protein [Streptomyces tailanensis]|uniref:hypothetical protein n=1 Tax=Streptomyces tailanensis TaxID=2569858 RepID=UPI001FEC826D|nr:hypothetical protein [Streptomyces tailanensis]